MHIYSVKSSGLHFTNLKIMNKRRVFVAVEGPSDIGKTQLIFNMLVRGTYKLHFSKIFKQPSKTYKNLQTEVPLVKKKLSIKFLRLQSVVFLVDLKDCVLIFNDSCEEIYSNKTCVKLANGLEINHRYHFCKAQFVPAK